MHDQLACKFGACQKKAVYHTVTGCGNMHVNGTVLCHGCLRVTKTLFAEQKLWCGTCREHILSGQYQRISIPNETRSWFPLGEKDG